jgi:tetratricopeptide (TPR) repeat protein
MKSKLILFLLLSVFSLPLILVYGESESQSELLKKGIEHFGLEEYDQAISIFDEILQRDPNHIEALYNKGNTLSNLGKHNEAIPYFEQVLKLEPKKYIAQLKLENSLSRISSYEFGFLDGVLEISVHDSQGNFIAFVRTTKIKAIEHEIIENIVDDWPVDKIINQNDQKFVIRQKEFPKIVEATTIYGFHEIPFSENVSLPLVSTWHYQIPVEKGDVVSYTYSIFRPVN